VNTSGSFTYTPAPFYSGTDSFTYAIDDGNGGSNTYTVTINSVNINDAPTASDANINAVEDIVYSGILPVATDLDLNQITYTLNTGALHGTVNVNANGDFTYTPTANYNGADNFTYTVSDGLGGSNTYTISINIAAVNDLPVANNDNITGLEDNSVTGNVLTNDSDLESPTLNAVVVSGPANGILTLNSNGSFTYTPNANWNGTETFTYKANDGTDNSNVATVTIAITPINDAPNNSAVTLPTILKDSGAHLITQAQLLANALDVDGDALTAINLAISVGNGVLVDNTNGTWTYTPGAKDESLVTFSYTVTDGTLIAAGTAKMDIVPVIAPIVPTPTPITPIIVDPITITPTPKPITTDPSTPTDFNPINKPSATNQATPQIASAINNNQNIIVNLDSNAIKNTNSLASRLNQQDAPFSILDLINLPSTSVANDLTEIFSSLTHNAQIQINAIEFAESKSSPAQLIGKIFFDNKIALTSVAVSAGLVAWAAQYGILFSSVLATLPAWRNLDPVAILGKVDDDDDDTEWDISEDENDQAAEENAIEILSEKAT
jgi:VCBS repeat-containing protein